jgi:hypothetical protein
VTARPAQSRDIARRPPALARHAAVPTRTDGMGAVATPARAAAARASPQGRRRDAPNAPPASPQRAQIRLPF